MFALTAAAEAYVAAFDAWVRAGGPDAPEFATALLELLGAEAGFHRATVSEAPRRSDIAGMSDLLRAYLSGRL